MAAAIEEAIPVATADEVGAWVSQVAAEALDARSRLVAAAERHAPRESSPSWTPASPPRSAAAMDPVDPAGTCTSTDAWRVTERRAPAAVGPNHRGALPAWYPPADEPPAPMSGVHSTLLCAELAALRALGHFQRYLRYLDEAGRRWALALADGSLVPVGAAMRHFIACHKLGLGSEDAFTVGVESGERAHGTFVKTIEAEHEGSSPMPWLLLGQYPLVWARMFKGGAVRVTALGPRQTEISISEVPFARFPYFRDAFRGNSYAALRGCVPRVFELAGSATATSFTVQAVW
jgi:hypothetical protein